MYCNPDVRVAGPEAIFMVFVLQTDLSQEGVRGWGEDVKGRLCRQYFLNNDSSLCKTRNIPLKFLKYFLNNDSSLYKTKKKLKMSKILP